MPRPRILLADDHAIVLEGLQRLLEPECDVVGVARNGVEMVELCASTRPDVVVADVSMPLLNGIDALRKMRRQGDQTRVVTPAQASRHGASHLVVGRPGVAASDRRAAAQASLDEMRSA